MTRQWSTDIVESAPHPAPEIPCRPAVPAEMANRTIQAMRDCAERNGWTVAATYARGTSMLARGKPGKVVDSLALRCNRLGERVVLIWLDGSISSVIAYTHERGLHRVIAADGVPRLTIVQELLLSVRDNGGTGTQHRGDSTVAEIVSAFPGTPKDSAQPTHQRYDFASLADGQIHKVAIGTELPMKANVVWSRAKTWAAKHGKIAKVEIEGTDAFIQFVDAVAAPAGEANPFEVQVQAA